MRRDSQLLESTIEPDYVADSRSMSITEKGEQYLLPIHLEGFRPELHIYAPAGPQDPGSVLRLLFERDASCLSSGCVA